MGTMLRCPSTNRRRCAHSAICEDWTVCCRISTSRPTKHLPKTIAANRRICAQQLDDAPPEHAEGRNQFDYLRRLADEIDQLDDGKSFAKNGVKAIGSSVPTCTTNSSSFRHYAAASRTRSSSLPTSTHVTCTRTRMNGRATSWSRPTSACRCSKRCSSTLYRSGTATKPQHTSPR